MRRSSRAGSSFTLVSACISSLPVASKPVPSRDHVGDGLGRDIALVHRLQHAAVLEDDDLVADAMHMGNVVINDDDAYAVLARIVYRLRYLLGFLHRQSRGRLVEQ